MCSVQQLCLKYSPFICLSFGYAAYLFLLSPTAAVENMHGIAQIHTAGIKFSSVFIFVVIFAGVWFPLMRTCIL